MSDSNLTHSARVVVEWDGEWWTVSDEGGEFARATETHQALRYVSDLMYGPSTTGPEFPRVNALAGLVGRVHGKTERNEHWAGHLPIKEALPGCRADDPKEADEDA